MIGWTLARYLSLRFLLMISAVFALNTAMIYVVDLVELLRRSGNIRGISAGYMAYLALLRAPSLSEQVLPFCVLFGAMATFLILSRKLELLIARAVGVSVWGFLLPAVAIAALIGIAAVVTFSPLAQRLQQRAELVERHIFGANDKKSQDSSQWIRQKSVDGETFVQAQQVSPDGTELSSVTAYVYDAAGNFEHMIKAQTGRLLPGVWQFNQARVTAPGEESFTAANYLLATTLSPQDVVRGWNAPEAVPLWDLPGAALKAEAAGFDGTAYRMQYHTLLARPLGLIAMILIAAAFSLRFFRFGGVERMVLGGVIAGFMLYGVAKFVGDLGGAGVLSPAVAAWAPPAVACLLSAFALLSQEDG